MTSSSEIVTSQRVFHSKKGNLIDFIGTKVVFWLVMSVFGSLALASVELMIAVLLQVLLSALNLTPKSSSAISFLKNWNPAITEVGIWLVIVGIIRMIGQFLVLQSGTGTRENIVYRLRKVILLKLLMDPRQKYMPLSQVNHYLGTIFNEAGQFFFSVSQVLAALIQSLILIGLMFWISWQEALVGFVGIVLIGFMVHLFANIVRAKARELPLNDHEFLEGIQRVLKNWIFVKVMRIGKKEYDRLGNLIHKKLNNATISSVWSNVAASSTPFLGILLLFVIIYLNQKVFLNSSINLLSFLYLFVRFIQSLANAVHTFGNANQGYPHVVHAYSLFQNSFSQIYNLNKVTVRKMDDIKVLVAPKIVAKNITFFYSSKKILNNLSFEVGAGMQCGVQGQSGSGKSTLLSLILGLEAPSSGEILVDDKIVSSDIEELYSVGYVGSEPFLINGTIRENISYGFEYVSDLEIWNALSKAHLVETIKELPLQLDYKISENGEGLSAGQKQRLCLARALVKNPTLLILDELTANLDIETEKEIIENISKLKGLSTVLLVSHRPSSLMYSDVLIRLEN